MSQSTYQQDRHFLRNDAFNGRGYIEILVEKNIDARAAPMHDRYDPGFVEEDEVFAFVVFPVNYRRLKTYGN